MNQFDYSLLIQKQLEGVISPEELTALNAWKGASSDNLKEYQTTVLVWENTTFDNVAALKNVPFNLDTEFDLLQSRIESAEKDTSVTPKNKVFTLNRQLLKVAAGLAVLIGLAAVLFINTGNTDFITYETENESAEILLADGSTIYLNSNSSVTYPTAFNTDNRTITFNGEGFFDIAKDPAHPFIINTPFEAIKVIGTSFNVRAFKNEAASNIAVSSGKVLVETAEESIYLIKDEVAIVNHTTGDIIKDATKALNDNAWLTHTIQFVNTPINEVLQDLENYYHVSFTYDNEALANCLFTSKFENESLEIVLETISTVLDININKTATGSYTLVGGNCK